MPVNWTGRAGALTHPIGSCAACALSGPARKATVVCLRRTSGSGRLGVGQGVSLAEVCIEGIVSLLFHTHLDTGESTAGTMDAGISQENGAAQDITFEVSPGEVFVVPQGLVHYNHNSRCEPNLFTQTFSSADGGAINLVGALGALRDGSAAGAAAIRASGAMDVEPSPLGSFALDAECLVRCGYPASGAPGDGLQDLPPSLRAMLGLGPVPEDDGDVEGAYGE